MTLKEKLIMNKNVPNILTMARIFCTPLIVILFLLPIPYGIGKYVALAIYVLGCLTDLIDGKIARKYGLVSDFGKFMDQIADKFITTTAMILVLFSGVTNAWAAPLILIVVVLRDILISGIRMVAANKNVVIAADIYGKVKSLFLDVANMILMLYVALRVTVAQNVADIIRYLGLAVLIVGAVLSIVSCLNYGINAMKALSPKNANNDKISQNSDKNNNLTENEEASETAKSNEEQPKKVETKKQNSEKSKTVKNKNVEK